jgi:hypothetical protein
MMMKAILSMITGFLVLVGCGAEATPAEKAQKTADFVKKASGGKVAPVVKDVGSMANSTQDRD